MSSFLKRLDHLLEDALKGGVVDAAASEGLRALARKRESRQGVLSLSSVLSWLGGGVAAVGSILLIAANWEGIPREVKLGGFLLLFMVTNGAGLWIRWKAPVYQKT